MQYVVRGMVALVALMSVMVVSAGTPVAKDVADTIIAKLRLARPDIPIASVEHSPVEGIYRLDMGRGGVVYASANGDFIFTGKMLGVEPGQFVDVQEVSMRPIRKKKLADVALSDMVVFPALGERKAYISVFTDVDCGYCRKLHKEIPELNASGVEVRYLAFPRAGIGSRSHKKIASAWCSDDRLDAMNRLKRGEAIPEIDCQTPVAMQYNLGNEIGVTGTPAIVLADGTVLPGYMPAEALISRLKL